MVACPSLAAARNDMDGPIAHAGPAYGADERPSLASSGCLGCLIFFAIFAIFAAVLILTVFKATSDPPASVPFRRSAESDVRKVVACRPAAPRNDEPAVHVIARSGGTKQSLARMPTLRKARDCFVGLSPPRNDGGTFLPALASGRARTETTGVSARGLKPSASS